ncbi:hypothetical protein FHW83_000658 [Duganella sp. SG902]|uniref:hypothetical protein n=1 Tax=Duganella sp. SG902 TaxID=2587016 RepID=UPI00159DC708|nr:hypothetical protein [Duganella sp. SG902]NVM74898.1 hypothetical protein [Duganella sp. SG902]
MLIIVVPPVSNAGKSLPLAKSIAWRTKNAQKHAKNALNPDLNRLNCPQCKHIPRRYSEYGVFYGKIKG